MKILGRTIASWVVYAASAWLAYEVYLHGHPLWFCFLGYLVIAAVIPSDIPLIERD